MILISFMALLAAIVILLIIIALRPTSKFCDFEMNISVKSLKIKFKTNEKSAPSTKRKH
ncbi:hypothetical protein SAMN05444401_4006 [Clostridium amylolyticum]|uniref:Uncharacterized protein n=1 Tax=Clostridium amylolyticum TaxID=1121298 RepID=A0A1M6MH16_9CLOT|nr:hypothetical protein SAMN05444401_4006 [Clostridium amylolyticum]